MQNDFRYKGPRQRNDNLDNRLINIHFPDGNGGDYRIIFRVAKRDVDAPYAEALPNMFENFDEARDWVIQNYPLVEYPHLVWTIFTESLIFAG